MRRATPVMRGVLLQSIILASGLALSCADSSRSAHQQAPATSGSCDVVGFTFKQGQLPHDRHNSHHSPVVLYTLPHEEHSMTPPRPHSSRTEAAAACQTDVACGMFTSDGYIIGAYRIENDIKRSRNPFNTEPDIIDWKTMHYCSGACCGTWVADDLIKQLLQPVGQTDGIAKRVSSEDLPLDRAFALPLVASLLQTACVGKPAPKTHTDGTGVPGTLECPQSCLVSCCGQLKNGDEHMGVHHFSQCTPSLCGRCKGFIGPYDAASSDAVVLMRQYVKAKTQQQGEQQKQQAG